MGRELRENAPAAKGSEEAGFTQFLTYESTLLDTQMCIHVFQTKKFSGIPWQAEGERRRCSHILLDTNLHGKVSGETKPI